MANILGIANQQQTQIIGEKKLKIFCSQKNVWDHFGLDRDVFSMLFSILVQNLAVFQLKKQTYQKIQFSMSSRVISLSKTIRKCINKMFLLLLR